jgi:hypothetical protein
MPLRGSPKRDLERVRAARRRLARNQAQCRSSGSPGYCTSTTNVATASLLLVHEDVA